MGNDQSQMRNITFSDKPVEKDGNLLIFEAEDRNTLITVLEEIDHGFIPYYKDLSALERNIKNLIVYRHPTIPKYYGSWKSGGKNFLAIERCKLLQSVLNHQNDIQICLGLKNILSSLIFLTEKAGSRHLNIAVSSIVEAGNQWKLMGFENLWKNTEVNIDLLEKSKCFRHKDSVDPQEIKNNGVGIEQYAFAVLCETVLRKDSQIPHIKDFIDYCKTHLKHLNALLRPNLSAVQLHPYFSDNDFVKIHSFLAELPLKSQSARQEFFTTLNERLKNFDEGVIGTQLIDLLLSRVTLLDQNAQMYLLPFLLRPQNDDISPDNTVMDQGLFTQEAFIRFVIPKLKKVFLVREIQIRLILLEFFPHYCYLFNKEELQDFILPQVLLGIKDTNDLLVTKTLICLAELIPILGASLVIGKNRKKLFSDGRPSVDNNMLFSGNEPRSITPVISSSIDILSSSPPLGNISDVSNNESDPKFSRILKNGDLSDQEADKNQGTDNEVEDGDEWSWDDANAKQIANSQNGIEEDMNSNLDNEDKSIEDTNSIKSQRESPRRSSKESSRKSSLKLVTKPPSTAEKSPELPKDYTKRTPVPDIDELDIKNKKFSKLEEKSKEFDYFKDMIPVIQKTNVLVVDENLSPVSESISFSVEEKPLEQEVSKTVAEEIPVQVNSKLFEMKIEEEAPDGWDEETDTEW